MDEETAGLTAVSQALEALRWDWDEGYMLGYNADRGWWASRRDQIGGLLTAEGPDGLRKAIREDYMMKPVARLPEEPIGDLLAQQPSGREALAELRRSRLWNIM